jgi:hypothetical protein
VGHASGKRPPSLAGLSSWNRFSPHCGDRNDEAGDQRSGTATVALCEQMLEQVFKANMGFNLA